MKCLCPSERCACKEGDVKCACICSIYLDDQLCCMCGPHIKAKKEKESKP